MRVEMKTGETVDVVPKQFAPLLYEDLLLKKPKYEINFKAESIEIEKDGKKTKHEQGDVKASIEFKQNLPIHSLVEGGWLQPPFVRPRNLLVDRNVVSNIKKITQGSSQERIQDLEWWLELVENDDLIINPILYAIEGDQRRFPTLDEFKESFEEALLEIKNVFPRAKLITFTDETYPLVFAELSRIFERRKKEAKFLIKTAPFVFQRVRDSKLSQIEAKILEIAKDEDLDLKSLPVLAILSCLYENNDGLYFQTARKIIKPKSNYTEENAYNTLADLNALEMFVGSSALSNSSKEFPPFAFTTCDKPIALFGCGLRFNENEFGENALNTNISINEHLFPRLNEEERQKLTERLST
ncbi:MAG: hypothetical protein ABIP06_13530 [Pyrinomonadaceae bacterium]